MWRKFIDIVELAGMVLLTVLEFLLSPVELVMFNVMFTCRVRLNELANLTVTLMNSSLGSMPVVLNPLILAIMSWTTTLSLK